MAAQQAWTSVRVLRATRNYSRNHNGPRDAEEGKDRLRQARQPRPGLSGVQRAESGSTLFGISARSKSAGRESLALWAHLSPMLLDLAKEIAGPEAAARAARLADPDYPYLD